MEAKPPPPPLAPRRPGRIRRLSRATLIVLATVVVLLVAARIALPYVLRRAIDHRLAAIPDYTGWVDDVGVSLWRGAYTLDGLVVLKREGNTKEPFFRADEIDFSLAWRELLRGKLVSDIELTKPSLTLIQAETTAATQMTADHRWQDVINDLFPIDITFLKVSDGQLRYINHTKQPDVDLRIAHVRATATGLRNRAGETSEEFPAKITIEGETIGGGSLKISTQAEPLAAQPHFLLKLELERVALPALNPFLLAYGGVDVSAGTFTAYMEATARDGHFDGYFKPFFDHVDFSTPPGESRPVGQQIWETLVRGFAWVFKNHARDQVATRIPFSGEIEDLKVGTWATFENLFRHAFIEPLRKKLDSRAAGSPDETKDAAAKSGG